MARDRNSPKPAGPAPTEASLHEAALTHLARYGTSRAGLLRVLDRRIERWARAAVDTEPEQVAAARAAARAAADRLVAAGALDDAGFAASRARSLTRAGRSRRAVEAHLQARGVASDLARAALPDDPEAELAAALAFARRRRIGPFRTAGEGEPLRELGMLARAGFAQETARRALALEAEEATDRINRARTS